MNSKEYPFGTVEFLRADEESEWDLIEAGMNPIMDYYNDDAVTDIFINQFDNIWIVKDGLNIQTNGKFSSEKSLDSWIRSVAVALKQPYLNSGNYEDGHSLHPILDARFPDGSRLMATSPLISPKGTAVALRLVPKKILSGKDLIDSGYLSSEMLHYLTNAVKQQKNIIFSGNTGSGKTTIVRVMILCIDRGVRIYTVEDTFELNVIDQFPLGVAFEAPNRHNVAADLVSCITATKRGQPDRIVVGEVRTPLAVYAYYDVCTSGTTGNMTTIHAMSAKKTLIKLALYLMKAGNYSYELASQLIRDEIDIVVQCRRDPEYGRRVTEIVEVREGELVPVFLFDEKTQQHKRVLFD